MVIIAIAEGQEGFKYLPLMPKQYYVFRLQGSDPGRMLSSQSDKVQRLIVKWLRL